ncbi:ABC-F family ATP-binding cassette domain-containing protein [Miltoncostaea oceani]|uniref:ABC-F family ATP-binding cassette domain-containing protein n=1 Tax=Miltoncostaea oceani TaxID=2843216 RepID=UPI001C3D6B05|nr:ABC-F family ATP-binding cassette domain-containing protein [Miltoncostaea oceani]
MLHLDSVSLAFGPRTVLRDVSLIVPDDARIGVVGPNGIGKSTLMRVMAGLQAPDEGTVLRVPPALRVGLLDQRGRPAADETVAQHLARRTGVADAEARLDALTAALADDPGRVDEYSEALDAFLALGGDDLAARAGAAMTEVGLSPDRLGLPMGALSGGQAARVGLAVLVLARVDLLLLDEPTNDLDFGGLDILERLVDAHRGAVVTVSHDRAFLDRCARRIVEVVEPSHEVREYAGGWTDYVAQRDQARARQYEAHGRYAGERGRLEDRMRRQRAWSEEGVKKEKKRPKDPDKIGRAMRAERSEQQTSKVRATERAMERLDVVEKPWEGWRLQLRLASGRGGGDVVAVLEEAVVRRGSFRLGPVDLDVRRGDRLVVTGPNGGGKSTLIGALLGRIPLDSGAGRTGPSIVVGEIEQERTALSGAPRLLDAVMERAGLRAEEARTLLAKFSLDADRVERPADQLSPGERTRALMAVLAAREVTCLVLDEPTNHLDLEAIEQLEEALGDYEGTLILVTHDRRMLERVAVTRRIEVRDGVVTERAAPVASGA